MSNKTDLFVSTIVRNWIELVQNETDIRTLLKKILWRRDTGAEACNLLNYYKWRCCFNATLNKYFLLSSRRPKLLWGQSSLLFTEDRGLVLAVRRRLQVGWVSLVAGYSSERNHVRTESGEYSLLRSVTRKRLVKANWKFLASSNFWSVELSNSVIGLCSYDL
jgi:hypothetical protein